MPARFRLRLRALTRRQLRKLNRRIAAITRYRFRVKPGKSRRRRK
jgi:hypothetical protein